jgi:hypothetical protein
MKIGHKYAFIFLKKKYFLRKIKNFVIVWKFEVMSQITDIVWIYTSGNYAQILSSKLCN